MTVEMRQEIVTLAQELPEEVLGEAIALLRSFIDERTQKEDAPSTLGDTNSDSIMAAYRVISEKYQNALRELA